MFVSYLLVVLCVILLELAELVVRADFVSLVSVDLSPVKFYKRIVCSEEASLLQICVALALGGVFQNKMEAEKISNIFKNNPSKLEVLYAKLSIQGKIKKAR